MNLSILSLFIPNMNTLSLLTYAALSLGFSYSILVPLKKYYLFETFKLLPTKQKVEKIVGEFFWRGFYTYGPMPLAHPNGTWTDYIVGCHLLSPETVSKLSFLRDIDLNHEGNYTIPPQLVFFIGEDSNMMIRLEGYFENPETEIFTNERFLLRKISFEEACDYLNEIKDRGLMTSAA